MKSRQMRKPSQQSRLQLQLVLELTYQAEQQGRRIQELEARLAKQKEN